MTYFALLWKAQTIEKYRMNYEKEKMNSILQQNPDLPRTSFHQRWTHCKHKTKKCMAKTLRQYFPEGSKFSNFVVCLRTDQTFPNFVWKSVLGFVGGIVLTYLCFIFFVFQLAISLIHATIMSSVIGVLLTLGLAFSYRARCLVFLLIPQFFSRVGRYTLTCYALVLILTGPATNTLKNSEVLSESMACSQEQWKSSLRQITESAEKPFDSMKETIKIMIDRIRHIALKMKENFLKIHTLGMHIASVFHNSFSWLNSITGVCNKKLGTPYDRCNKAIEEGIKDCKAKLDASQTWSCHPFQIGHAVCETFKPLRYICAGVDYMKGPVIDTVKRKFQSYSEHISTMLFFSIHVHHSYSFSSNSSHSASQVAAGIVTEIRGKADPMLTWISWSSCVTSTFLLLIIFRAKHYQSMFETRSRFDNRYITQELRDLDLKRVRQGRETVLPLNARESAKYVTTTSFRLVASEKRYLTRSAVFTAITTFKLLIHMVADYSLYWVLMTIRYHGRYQSPWKYGPDDEAMNVLGGGAVASILRTIIEALSVPLHTPMPDPMTCLPDPYPPNFQRYAQIGVLILLLWFFALLEPYGLRLRHKIMSLYSPARAKARAGWLYNHILRTRGSFLKYARRKLHRMYKYSGNEKLTFRYWVETHIPFSYLRYFFGYRQRYPQCVLCGVTNQDDSNVELTRCETSNCPGLYCTICFNDIGQLCTICLTPVDYGDLSDVSLEKGSSESSDDDTEADSVHNRPLLVNNQDASPSFLENYDSDSPAPVNKTGSMWFSAYKAKEKLQEEIELLADYKKSKTYNESTPDMLQHELKKAMTKRLMQNKNRKPLSILTHSTNLKKNETFSFKICNNPMVYTALVSYDNPTQSNKQGFCENRVKIKEALNNLSARQHGVNMCEHTSFWLKRKKRKYSVPLKIYIQFNLLKYSRKMRTRPTRDLTAFISNFYKIKRKGIRFSIAKIYATSKIGKILRRKYKVIRRRRPKKNSLFFSLYNMFSRSKTYTKIRNDKHSGRIQEDSHDLTEIIISSPRHIADQVSLRPVSVNLRKNHERKRVQHARVELSSNKSHGAEPKNVITRNKSRGSISEYFGNNLFSPVAMLFNQTNNIPPLLKFETNYKPKEGNKNLSELFTTKRKPVLPSKVTMPNDSECMNNVTNDLVRTPENVKQVCKNIKTKYRVTETTYHGVKNNNFQGTDSIYTDSRSEHSTKSCSSKQSNFKKSILSVKKYCSNITHGQKNKSKTHSEDKCITIQPALQFTTTQDLEAGKLSHTKEETRCYCDANVGTTKETRSCSIQNTKSDDITSYTESTTTSCNSSTDTVKHESVHSRDTVTYESEDASSVQFSNYSVNKKRKPNSVQLDNKSTETASTITANATTGTSDWWSPIMERKERSTGDQVRVTTKRKPWNVAKLNLKSSLASTDTKLVSFKNKAEIIPSGIMPIRRLRSDLLKKGQRGNQLFTANSILSTNTDGTSQKPNRSVLKGARTKPTKMKRLIWQPAHR